MVIRFVCPNGHELTASEERAGKPGKCPKCDTKFVVPAADDENSEDLAEPDLDDLEVPDEHVGDPDDANPDVIVFLCPNGHKLNGPSSLKGKPGKCPHCGSKFRIPDDDDEEADDEVDAADEALELPEDIDDLPEIEPADEPLPPLAPGAHVLAQIIERLRQRLGGETELTIYLGEDEVLTVRYFAPRLSQLDYGVFATADSEGQYTITTIPWSRVTRIEIPGVESLPSGIFE